MMWTYVLLKTICPQQISFHKQSRGLDGQCRPWMDVFVRFITGIDETQTWTSHESTNYSLILFSIVHRKGSIWAVQCGWVELIDIKNFLFVKYVHQGSNSLTNRKRSVKKQHLILLYGFDLSSKTLFEITCHAKEIFGWCCAMIESFLSDWLGNGIFNGCLLTVSKLGRHF